MLEFEYAPPRAPITETIKINGEPIGEVWTTAHGYQCQLKFGPLQEDYRGLTLNGTGDTKTAAIRNAMRNGREDAERLQRAVQIAERKAANKKHRQVVESAAVSSLVGIVGVSKDVATVVVNAISQGKIRNVTINY